MTTATAQAFPNEEFSEAQSFWRELGNLQKLAEASRFMWNIHNMAGDHQSTLVDAPKISELGAAIVIA